MGTQLEIYGLLFRIFSSFTICRRKYLTSSKSLFMLIMRRLCLIITVILKGKVVFVVVKYFSHRHRFPMKPFLSLGRW